MNQETTIDPLKCEQLCDLAKDYVLEKYFCAGERAYFWEEWGNPEHDVTAYTASGYCLPSDYSGYYRWSEISSCEIKKAEVTEYDPGNNEYKVEVTASVIILSGNNDEDDDDGWEEERIVSCYIEAEAGQLYVSNAEE